MISLKPRMPGLDPLRGGELVLLSLRTLHILDPDLSPQKVLESIAPDVAAVAVLGDAGDEVVGAAVLGLPLLQLPTATSVRDVEHRDESSPGAAGRLVFAKHAVQQALTSAAVDGVGLQGLADEMADLSGCAVIVSGGAGDPVIGLRRASMLATRSWWSKSARGTYSIPERGQRSELKPGQLAWVAATGRSPRGGSATISLVGPPESLVPVRLVLCRVA